MALRPTFLRADLDPNRAAGVSEVESLPVVVKTSLVHADLILTGPQTHCGLAAMVGPGGGHMPASVKDADLGTRHGRDQTSNHSTDDLYVQGHFSRLLGWRRAGGRRFPSAEHDSFRPVTVPERNAASTGVEALHVRADFVVVPV